MDTIIKVLAIINTIVGFLNLLIGALTFNIFNFVLGCSILLLIAVVLGTLRIEELIVHNIRQTSFIVDQVFITKINNLTKRIIKKR